MVVKMPIVDLKTKFECNKNHGSKKLGLVIRKNKYLRGLVTDGDLDVR